MDKGCGPTGDVTPADRDRRYLPLVLTSTSRNQIPLVMAIDDGFKMSPDSKESIGSVKMRLNIKK
jgi:hypothetical protein